MNIKTKYKTGDRVYTINHAHIIAFVIKDIVVHVFSVDENDTTITSIEYKSAGTLWRKESECFPSQAALLKEMQTKE